MKCLQANPKIICHNITINYTKIYISFIYTTFIICSLACGEAAFYIRKYPSLQIRYFMIY